MDVGAAGTGGSPADGREGHGTATPGFRHDALLYDSADALTAVAAPFLLDGLAAGDAAVIAVGPDTTGPLRAAVGVDPAIYLRELPVPVEPPEATTPAPAEGDVTDYIGLRHTLRTRLATVEGPADLIEDYLLAVVEMTSNAVRHGRRPVGLRLWTAPDRLVCTISDAGTGWDEPFAGYGPAHGEDLSHGGMGLWLARQLCDHVAIRREAAGVSVRLTVAWA